MEQQMVHYFDTYSILVITKESVIRRLYTPIEVLCIDSVDDLEYGAALFVDEVFPDEDDILLYKIKGNLYAYKHFMITTSSNQ